VRIVGRPSAEVIDWPSDKDFSGDLKVEVEVDVRPEFDLPALDGVTVEIDAVETDDAASTPSSTACAAASARS
jgi:trigger factor